MTACFDFKTEWKQTHVMKMINFTNTCKKKIYIIRDEND